MNGSPRSPQANEIWHPADDPEDSAIITKVEDGYVHWRAPADTTRDRSLPHGYQARIDDFTRYFLPPQETPVDGPQATPPDLNTGTRGEYPTPSADAPLVLPRAAVESLHHFLGQLLDEGRPQGGVAAADGICTATIKTLDGRTLRCAQAAGHYDEGKVPEPVMDDGPGGWHRSAGDPADRVTWSDWADGATPHKEATGA